MLELVSEKKSKGKSKSKSKFIDLLTLEGKRNGRPGNGRELDAFRKIRNTMTDTIIFLIENYVDVLDLSKVRSFGFYYCGKRWEIYEATVEELGPGKFRIRVSQIENGVLKFEESEIWRWVKLMRAMIALAIRMEAVSEYLNKAIK